MRFWEILREYGVSYDSAGEDYCLVKLKGFLVIVLYICGDTCMTRARWAAVWKNAHGPPKGSYLRKHRTT